MRVKIQSFSTVMCLLGIVLGFACKMWFPEYWTDWYILVLIVYWAIEMVMSFVLERYEGRMSDSSAEGKKFMRVYMISKIVKVIISLVLIGIGSYFIGSVVRRLLLVFIGSALFYHLVYMGYETFVITQQMKKEKASK